MGLDSASNAFFWNEVLDLEDLDDLGDLHHLLENDVPEISNSLSDLVDHLGRTEPVETRRA